MAENKQQQQLKEITERLEQGVQELFTSEKYMEYLRVMSQFHNYSFSNTLLIAMQKPDATLVAGYGAWQKKFERNVMRGEKAIKIFAPAPRKVAVEREKLDPDTKRPVLDENGEPVMETVMIQKPAFKVTSVFDVSQTDGKPLPELAEVEELTADVEGYAMFFEALRHTSKVPIAFENIESGAHGYYHQVDKRIAIDLGMSEAQNVKTAIHEIAHSRMHDIDMADAAEGKIVDRSTREVQAESVAYTICQHYGIETSEYSFGYVAGWSSGRDMKELRASMEVIRKEANSIINEIDGHLAELRQEREQEAELQTGQEQEAEPQTEPEQMKQEAALQTGHEQMAQETELAYQIGDRYFAIQEATEGYDYTFYDANLKELDGGVYDNPDITMAEAIKEILEDEGLTPDDGTPINYDDLMEKVEAKEQQVIHELQNGDGLRGMSTAEIEETVLAYAQSELDAMGLEQEVEILGAKVYGSRSRDGLYREDSDIDVVLSYSGDISEDSFFNALHEHGMTVGGMLLDINPISLEKTGTLEDYLEQANKYLEEKEIRQSAEEQLPTITFYVAECAEYPDMGNVYENLTLEEALDKYEDTTSSLYSPKSIGFDLKDGSIYDGKFDLLVGGELQKDIINEISHYRASTLVQQAIAGLERLLIERGQMQENGVQENTIVPVYRQSFDEARERGEFDTWRASHRETVSCAIEISKDFSMAYHERRMPEFLQQMVDKYGMERCKIVMASTIQLADYDGRYYPSIKEEAAKVFIPNVDTTDKMKDRRIDYRTDCHPVMVNSAFRELLKMEREQTQEKVAHVSEQDAKAPKASVLNRLHEKQKQVATEKQKPDKAQDKKRGVEL